MHVASYGLDRFVEDSEHLSEVVRDDSPALGGLTGLRVAHLQCHLGTDTVSLARLGADVVGRDFSPSALEVARDLADRAGERAAPIAAGQAGFSGTERNRQPQPETSLASLQILYHGFDSRPRLFSRTVPDLRERGQRRSLFDGHPGRIANACTPAGPQPTAVRPEEVDPTHLVGVPVGKRVGYPVGDAMKRCVRLPEVVLAHSAVVARAAGASSVMTWTYVPARAAAWARTSCGIGLCPGWNGRGASTIHQPSGRQRHD